MKIESGKVVKLAVVNHLLGKIWGTFEQVGLYPDDFEFPPLRDALLGMSAEQNGSVSSDYITELQYSSELVFNLPTSNFRGVNELKVGMIFKTECQMKVFNGRVTSINDEFVTLDCNHPFSGTSDSYVGFIVINVRDLTQEELNGKFKPTLIAI